MSRRLRSRAQKLVLLPSIVLYDLSLGTLYAHLFIRSSFANHHEIRPPPLRKRRSARYPPHRGSTIDRGFCVIELTTCRFEITANCTSALVGELQRRVTADRDYMETRPCQRVNWLNNKRSHYRFFLSLPPPSPTQLNEVIYRLDHVAVDSSRLSR